MNEPSDPLPEPGDDPLLEEALSHLKRLEPPLETRLANRMAVAAELDALGRGHRNRHLPWWRRSISIPVPIAASLLALTTLALPSTFRGWQQQIAVQSPETNQPAQRKAYARPEKATIAKQKRQVSSALEYRASETYLCGIGRLNFVSGHFIKDQNHE